ncbi:MAG: IS630 transposase-related protein [Candidatus Bathyarchaeota archaeon]|nr:IS630 transposase-related protein [Candidatus Termiticorpusculum sp.]
MPKPITNKEREKIIKHKQNNENETDIAQWLSISQSTVTKLWAQYRKTGTYLPNYENCGRPSKLSEAQIDQIKAEVNKNPDRTLLEIIEMFDLKISESGLSKVFKKLGLTFKKRCSMQTTKKDVM